MTIRRSAIGLGRLLRLEHRSEPVLDRRRFAGRMGLALLAWAILTLAGLAIGMSGYLYFEGMSVPDAFVNAAMILSGMGVFDDLKNANAKIFAGFYAMLSGLIILIATGLVLAPVLHRIMHRLHIEDEHSRD
ncbi:hypothetical protein [Pseudorhodoplanes sp.]|uniref:hypothetical protein n=1 Tax=Pseudorhodoplanes sp. TaxID=1934341 RepID=UPI002C3816A6|nr:hypothetical protein [Pseudorhodoplanes sp.]HWV40817.1 hypothetical protein [Pseudorhodoplanes sp.]